MTQAEYKEEEGQMSKGKGTSELWNIQFFKNSKILKYLMDIFLDLFHRSMYMTKIVVVIKLSFRVPANLQ